MLRSHERTDSGHPNIVGERLLIAGVGVLVFAVVLFATAWLATTALVAALCWVAGREWLREHHRPRTTAT